MRPPPPSALACLLAGALLLCRPPAARAADPAPSPTPSARDTLRKAIEPVVDLFAREPAGKNRAFALRLRVAEASVQPPELIGATLIFRGEAAPANKVYFQFPALGAIVTVCRQGQTVWASPASLLAPILEKVNAAKLTKADQEPLAPLRLSLPTSIFWFLFRFVGVHDAGSQALDAVPCRELDVDPPDGGKATKDKYVRLWVRTDTYRLARVDWRKDAADHGSLVIEDSQLAPALPEGDFQPTAAQRADLLDIPVSRFRPFLTLLGKEEEKRQKEQRERLKLAGTARN